MQKKFKNNNINWLKIKLMFFAHWLETCLLIIKLKKTARFSGKIYFKEVRE